MHVQLSKCLIKSKKCKQNLNVDKQKLLNILKLQNLVILTENKLEALKIFEYGDENTKGGQ